MGVPASTSLKHELTRTSAFLTFLCQGSPVELNLYYFGLPHLCLRDFLPSNNGITNWPSSGLALSPFQQARDRFLPLHLQAARGFPTSINAFSGKISRGVRLPSDVFLKTFGHRYLPVCDGEASIKL